MNKALKATLLSALIFPGLGHLMLKRYPQALFLILSTSIACYLLIINVIETAMQVIHQIEQGEIGLTTAEISNALNLQGVSDYSSNCNIAMIFIMFIWIIAAIDAYRLGKKN
ncbi:hypothetical protein [Psychromonas hadalis]|uniref:hypothetical protein n=1 Tax=Psychromonas hadalis TaxID=211669 RepID=UPI0003B7A591|nr:hypothetical protein [Psychromonas hadalis]